MAIFNASLAWWWEFWFLSNSARALFCVIHFPWPATVGKEERHSFNDVGLQLNRHHHPLLQGMVYTQVIELVEFVKE